MHRLVQGGKKDPPVKKELNGRQWENLGDSLRLTMLSMPHILSGALGDTKGLFYKVKGVFSGIWNPVHN